MWGVQLIQEPQVTSKEISQWHLKEMLGSFDILTLCLSLPTNGYLEFKEQIRLGLILQRYEQSLLMSGKGKILYSSLLLDTWLFTTVRTAQYFLCVPSKPLM